MQKLTDADSVTVGPLVIGVVRLCVAMNPASQYHMRAWPGIPFRRRTLMHDAILILIPVSFLGVVLILGAIALLRAEETDISDVLDKIGRLLQLK
jgi:hypothetical protein